MAYKWDDPNHIPTGMILQATAVSFVFVLPSLKLTLPFKNHHLSWFSYHQNGGPFSSQRFVSLQECRIPYYWVYKPLLLGWVSHPLLYGNIGSLDPIAHVFCFCLRIPGHECVQQLFGSCMTVLHGGCKAFDPLTSHEGWGIWWTQAMCKKNQDI